jgi:hypothetical protein
MNLSVVIDLVSDDDSQEHSIKRKSTPDNTTDDNAPKSPKITEQLEPNNAQKTHSHEEVAPLPIPTQRLPKIPINANVAEDEEVAPLPIPTQRLPKIPINAKVAEDEPHKVLQTRFIDLTDDDTSDQLTESKAVAASVTINDGSFDPEVEVVDESSSFIQGTVEAGTYRGSKNLTQYHRQHLQKTVQNGTFPEDVFSDTASMFSNKTEESSDCHEDIGSPPP